MTAGRGDDAQVIDTPAPRTIIARDLRLRGAKWDVVTDTVELHADVQVTRDVVVHPGAVGIVALGADQQVTMLRQYRHPVAADLWEIPAGLLDEPGEAPWDTAQRELVEEVGLVASTWHTLVDLHVSPGMSNETVRVFLARDLSPVDSAERPPLQDEERDFVVRQIPLDEAVAQVMDGHIHNSLAVAGLLAASQARRQGWTTVRPADEPWLAPAWGPAPEVERRALG